MITLVLLRAFSARGRVQESLAAADVRNMSRVLLSLLLSTSLLGLVLTFVLALVLPFPKGRESE